MYGDSLIQSIFYRTVGDAVWATGFCGVPEAAVIAAMIGLCFHDTEMSHYGYGSIGKQKLNEDGRPKDCDGGALYWQRGDVGNKKPGKPWSPRWYSTLLKAVVFYLFKGICFYEPACIWYH